MLKDVQLLKSKKGIASLVIVVVSLIFCVFMNTDKTEEIQAVLSFGPNSIVTPILQSGDIVEQEFAIGENSEEVGVGILFATYGTKVENGTLEFQLLDENDKVIGIEKKQANLIEDGRYLEVWFDDVNSNLNEDICKLRISFSDIEGESIAIWLSVTDDSNYDCLYNGEMQTSDVVSYSMEKNVSTTYKDIRLYFVFGLILMGVYLIGYKIKWNHVRNKLKECKDNIDRETGKKLLVPVCVTLINIFLACILEYFLAINSYVNPYRRWLIFVVLTLIAIVLVYRKYIWKYAHIYFFCVVMLVGITNIISISPTTYISWDDEIHYCRTAYISWGGNVGIAESDRAIWLDGLDLYYKYGGNRLQKEVRAEWESRIAVADQNAMVEWDGVVNHDQVAYIPAAVSLYVGRALGLNPTTNFMLGKFVNLLCYASMLAFAIKSLNGRGKILVAALGLIPTVLFLATSYSCDWWIYSFIICGYSIFLGEIQRKGSISTGKFIEAVVIMAIGILPKAIYFPLIFPLMVMRKEKYSESKKCRWIAFMAMIVLLASFILPMLFNGAGTGDIRGGAEVNSTEQIAFILSDVWGYVGILLRFLWDYLSPDMAYEYITNLAYLGRVPYATICMLTVCVATVLDNEEKVTFGKKEALMKAGNYLGALGSLALAATAMYISYTPVGIDSIGGCQRRYILPVLFSVLFFVGENGIHVSEKTKEKVFVIAVNVMSFVVLLGCYQLCISLY